MVVFCPDWNKRLVCISIEFPRQITSINAVTRPLALRKTLYFVDASSNNSINGAQTQCGITGQKLADTTVAANEIKNQVLNKRVASSYAKKVYQTIYA
ncbi:hypothetical protein BCU63_26450 [Vibrio splendidus]|nr:hypothetical protein BCU63_26450 [Vibrio splendidus]